MTVLLKTLQVLLALSVLVFVHELGHFFSAKMFGIRVEKFFLFFDIGGRRLFSTRSKWFTSLFPSSKDWETEYGIGWLPLGGYCKISGMVDESLDMESLKRKPQDWEFRTHPAWQKLIVMAAGVFNNFLLAIIVFSIIMARFGEAYISNEGARIYAGELAGDLGFRTGDHIIRLDDFEPDNFGMISVEIARRGVRKVCVERDGDTLNIYVDRSRIGELLGNGLLFDLAVPFTVDSVDALSPNAAAGLVRGDRILEIDGTAVEYLQDARPILAAKAGGSVDALVGRDSVEFLLPMQVDSLGKLGIYMQSPSIRTKRYEGLQAVPAGLRLTGSTIGGYLRDLKLVATPSTGAYKSVGSFIAIGQIFPSSWDWYQFLYILALLSIMLGVMNLIPIPGLDGGHIVITLYEMITGRKPSERFLQITQIIGMMLLVALMLLAFGNDLLRIL